MFTFLWDFFFPPVGHSEAMATALDFKVAISFTGKAIVLHLPHCHRNEILILKKITWGLKMINLGTKTSEET